MKPYSMVSFFFRNVHPSKIILLIGTLSIRTQTALMRLLPTEERLERHPRTTQYIKLEAGFAQIIIGGDNTLHNVVNVGKDDLLRIID